MKWLILSQENVTKRQWQKLAAEIMAAIKEEGAAVKKKEDT